MLQLLNSFIETDIWYHLLRTPYISRLPGFLSQGFSGPISSSRLVLRNVSTLDVAVHWPGGAAPHRVP
jgi:hypothetical protein